MSKIMELGIQLSLLMNGNYDSKLTKANKLIGDLMNKTKGLRQQTDPMKKYRESLSKQMDLLKKLDATGWSDKQLLSQFERQEQVVAKYRKELEAAGVDVSKLAEHESRLTSQLQNTESRLQRLQDAQSRYNEVRAKLFNWGNIKADFLETAAYFKTFQKPIKVSMDFEAAMAKVKAVAFSRPGADMGGFKLLREQAIQLGRDTKYTSVEAANTQENLLRGGMSWKETMQAMPGVMAMAASESIPLADSANMIVASLAGLNLPAEKATRLADLFANMSISAKANISTIYETVSKMSGLATELNMPVEHIAALAAAGQMKGVDASSLGTGIKTGLINLAQLAEGSTGKGKNKVMNNGVYRPLDLVISKNGKMREIDELLGDLFTKLQKYEGTERLNILSDMFGKRQADIWSKLIQSAGVRDSNGQTLLGKYIQSNYTEADGTTQRMQNINLDTMQGQIDLLTSAWTGLQQKIGDALEPINRYVVETLTKGINKVTEFMNSHESLINTLVRAGYILGGVFVGFKIAKYIKLVYDFITAWVELQAATAAASMSGAASAVGSVGTAAGTAASGVGLMTSSMNLLWLKIMLVVGAIQLLITYWDQIKALPGMIDNVMKSAETKKSLGQVSTAGMSRDNADYGIAAMNSAYQSPSLAPRKRALGGLINRPEIALIGEAGPEVIIPLSNGKKSRGLQMLNTAAEMLGVNVMPPSIQNITQQTGPGTSISNVIRNIASQNMNQSPSQIQSQSQIANNIMSQSMSYLTGGFNMNTAGDLLTSSEQLLNNSPVMNQNRSYNQNSTSVSQNMSPVINITVNANNANLEESGANNLANDIYDQVKSALSEIMNNQDRLSFA